MTTEVTVEAVNEMVAAQFTGTPNRCAELGDGYAVARYDVDQTALRPGGFISGPAQFGLADAALWYLVFAAIGRIEPMALTSELSIRYLRPAQGSVLWARATLESAGRRNVVGTVHVWCDDRVDKPTATAQGTYALPYCPRRHGAARSRRRCTLMREVAGAVSERDRQARPAHVTDLRDAVLPVVLARAAHDEQVAETEVPAA